MRSCIASARRPTIDVNGSDKCAVQGVGNS